MWGNFHQVDGIPTRPNAEICLYSPFVDTRKGAASNRNLTPETGPASDEVTRGGPYLQTSAARRLTYRPDIDGLRAIAVIAVLGYHLGILHLSGGFVGVDVFFVISGYLMGSLIISDAKGGKFSVAAFYARRIRRIIPALVTMLILVFILSYFYLFPSEFVRFSWSALYSALSVSNIFFLHHSGYFDALSSTQPLLHTWSLAVEEQFYVLFPLFVVIVFRYAPRLLNASIVLICIGSFALSAHGTFVDPDSSFYLAHTRAWELLLGTLVANQSWTMTFPALTRNVLALLGLAMIGFAILTYNPETPFPGATALVPCLGATFIIAAGQSGMSFVGSLLSLRPVVFIGLISYSLYLWHWPIIFFQRTDSMLVSSVSPFYTRLVVIICSLAIATLSWQFVEKPLRRQSKTTPNSKVFIGGLLGLGSSAVLALLVASANGLPGRFSAMAVQYASYLDYGQAHFRPGKCFIDTYSGFDHQECLRREHGNNNYLLIGDSHAAQLWYGLSKLLKGVHVLQATAAGCMPEFTQPTRVVPSCNLLMNYMFNSFLVSNRVDRLLIAARWRERDVPGLERVLAWAKERTIPVTLFGPMVEYDLALPRILAYAAQSDDPRTADSHLVKNEKLDRILWSLASEYNAKYISFYDLLCASNRCSKFVPDGSPLEFDTDHLTKEGSLFVVQKLIDTGQLR
jgi:peptidoglycan/LPS O-acetylase OafA/YrhL